MTNPPTGPQDRPPHHPPQIPPHNPPQPPGGGWSSPGGSPYPGPRPGDPYPVPDPAMTSRQRRWLPIAVVVAIVALAAVVVIIVTSISGSADATDYGLAESAQDAAPEVSQLAADTAQAADDVDIEAGLALMCQAPSTDQINELEGAIADANETAGGTAEKSLTITEVNQDGDGGQFVVTVDGEGELDEYGFTVTAEVQQVGDAWCIAEIHIDG